MHDMFLNNLIAHIYATFLENRAILNLPLDKPPTLRLCSAMCLVQHQLLEMPQQYLFFYLHYHPAISLATVVQLFADHQLQVPSNGVKGYSIYETRVTVNVA